MNMNASCAFMHQPATKESEEAFDTDNIFNILFQSLLSNVHKCET